MPRLLLCSGVPCSVAVIIAGFHPADRSSNLRRGKKSSIFRGLALLTTIDAPHSHLLSVLDDVPIDSFFF